jgi:pimeloyl-ACP methyl ester carboxylesterase
MMNIESKTVRVQNTRVRYFEGGAGERTVVLLHGGGLDCAELSWGLLLPELAAKTRVIAPDYPGYGESETASVSHTVDYLTGFLGAFLDALEVQRAALAGISLGGAVSIGFTLQHPERVERLALVDSYGIQRSAPAHRAGWALVKLPFINALTWQMLRSRPAVRWSLGELLKRPGALTEELVDLAYFEMMRPNAGKAWREFQQNEIMWSGTRTVYLDRLHEITVPTLIVHGDLDGAVPPECAREAHQRIPGAALHWMEGCGHWPNRDNPEAFNQVMKTFLLA